MRDQRIRLSQSSFHVADLDKWKGTTVYSTAGTPLSIVSVESKRDKFVLQLRNASGAEFGTGDVHEYFVDKIPGDSTKVWKTIGRLTITLEWRHKR